MQDPFHSGERCLQEYTGERIAALRNARMIMDHISPAAERFIASQSHCVIGRHTPGGNLEAFFQSAHRGFATTNKIGERMTLKSSEAKSRENCMAPRTWRPGEHLGVLFIDLSIRRRLRVNGTIIKGNQNGLSLSVLQAFGNCPKYIQRREPNQIYAETQLDQGRQGSDLTKELVTWIENADTFFVASAHPDGPADVSHRGGMPGFIEVVEGALHIPDYPGNSIFGTLGNFALNPKAGLTFVDFNKNRQLQLSGIVELDLGKDVSVVQNAANGRYWKFIPQNWTVSTPEGAFGWDLVEYSPFNPAI